MSCLMGYHFKKHHQVLFGRVEFLQQLVERRDNADLGMQARVPQNAPQAAQKYPVSGPSAATPPFFYWFVIFLGVIQTKTATVGYMKRRSVKCKLKLLLLLKSLKVHACTCLVSLYFSMLAAKRKGLFVHTKGFNGGKYCQC